MKILNRHKGRALSVLPVVLVCLLLAGCSSAPDETASPQITLAGFRDLAPGRQFFFPESRVCRTWESLVGIDDDQFAPVPELAESWQMSADGKTWIFHLRKGVAFHDGTPFDADAVITNFRRYVKAPGKTRFYRFRMDRYYPGFKGIQKRDSHTVELVFHRPVPGLPNYMAGWGSPIFSPACLDPDTLAFVSQPSGTGPFMVSEHQPEQYVVLRRFDRYWGTPALAETIRIRVIPDVHTRFSALKSREIQGVIDLGGMTPALAAELAQSKEFQVSVEKNSLLHFLAVNGERFPFDHDEMRQALSLAIDRNTVSQAFCGGYFPPAGSILSHASGFFKSQIPEFQPEKAAVLAEKVLRGRRVAVDLVLPSKLFNYPYKEIAQYLQAVLAPLGLDVRIRQVEAGGFNPLILAGDYHLYVRHQGLPHADPAGIFEDYMRFDGAGGMDKATQNRRFHYHYKNPEAEALLDRVAATLDMAERTRLFYRLQDIAATTFPIIPLVHETTLVVSSRDIQGYEAKVYGATLATARWSR